VVDLVRNQDQEGIVEDGFNGLFVFHDTRLVKEIAASAMKKYQNVDYTFHLIREYMLRKSVRPIYLREIFEC
jgi:hypothetical protein